MCHEEEAIDLLRRLLVDDGVRSEAEEFLQRVDEEKEAVRRARDPYGDDWRQEW